MSFGRMGARGGFAGLGIVGGSTANIILSGSTFTTDAAVGTLVGTLSVTHGVGSYTFTLTSNPGTLFQIVGNSLELDSATIAVGSYPVTIQASNGAGSIFSRSFLLTALPVGGAIALQADFSSVNSESWGFM